MSARLRKVVCMFLLVGMVLTAIPALAQEITGTISGLVKDSNGAVVAGATVTIKNTDTNTVVRSINTNEEGLFTAPFLPVGHYSVTVEASGFKKYVKTNIELNVNDRFPVDATLEAGAISEEVVVSAGAVQVETQTATAAGLISSIELRELPIANRNFVQLTTLMPGVSSNLSDQQYIGTTNPNSGSVNTVNISINGGRSSQNSWTIDGADNVDRGSNLTLLNYPSVDAIAEFKVLRNHYSAEYGRNAAGQVNVITKSGTSSFHGSAYEFFRNDKLNANTFLNNASGRFTTDTKALAPDLIVPAGDPRAGKKRLERPLLRYNNFGYTIGGPVYIPGVYNEDKSKTFFFWSQEFRRVITYSNFNAIVPTALERQGVFATPVCVQLNAAGTACAQTATNISNLINPAAAAYIKDIYGQVPLPQTGNTLVSNVKNIFNHRQELVRIDHNFSDRFTVSGRYLHDKIPTEEPGGLFGPNSLLPGVATTRTDSPGYSYVFRSVQTFSPTMTNEIGYSFSYGAIVSRIAGLAAAENSPDIISAVKLPFTSTLPRIPTVSPGFSAAGTFGPYDDFNRNHNIYDNLTKIFGRHTVKFGTSIHHYQKTENAAGNNAGTFAFTTTGVPTGTSGTLQQWANFLLGKVSTFTQASEDLTPDVRANSFEFFVQDDFRWKSNVTINIGLRYSMFRQPYDVSGKLTNFNPALYDPSKAVQINPTTGNIIPGTGDPLNGIVIADGNSPFGSKVANEDNNDFAPVIGFAWDPWKDGKTAIRGGYGISYDTVLYGITEVNIFTNVPYVSTVSISNTSLNDPGAGVPTISAAPKSLRGTPFDYDTPYVQQWSFDVQREVTKNFMLDVGYFGSKGTHLLGAVDLNLVPPGAAIAAGIQTPGSPVTTAITPRLNAIRPYKGFIAVNGSQTWFNSNYHSLQVASEKRWSDGSLVRIAYTWSHALTDNQTDRSTAAQNFYNRALDYGPAQFDRRHIFVASYVYQIPFFKNQSGILGRALGGWQLSGIISAATGLPQTVTTSNTDPAGLGFLGASQSGARPDVNGDPNLLSDTRTRLKWFNTTAFQEVPVGQNRVGNSPRGVFYGPGYNRLDLTLSKRFKITEGTSIQFRGDMFNALNVTTPTTLSLNRTVSTFGQVTAFRDPRTVQLGLKFLF